MIVQLTKTLSPLSRLFLPGMRLTLVSALLLLVPFGFNPNLSGQDEPSAVFPEERHRELMDELDFSPPEKEEEKEPEKVPDDADWDWDWGDFDLGMGKVPTILVFVVLLGLLGYLIYRMLGDVSLRKRTREEEEPDEINIEDIEEEQLVAAGVSLSLLERAERAGQYDVAVRLMYIQLLKELQDGGLIKYRKDFSNRDYQNQLRGRKVLPEFRTVTREYERYWFGKYPIDRLSYRNTYQRFNALYENVRRSSLNANQHA